MIIGMIKDSCRYTGLSGRIAEALQWLQTIDLKVLQEGKNPVKGEEIFCNVCVYNTMTEKDRVWEGHRKYIDIHFMIDGEEIMHISPACTMSIKQEYNEETDFIEFEGKEQQRIVLQKGMFLLAFPEDIHRTALQVQPGLPRPVRKGIVKVLL